VAIAEGAHFRGSIDMQKTGAPKTEGRAETKGEPKAAAASASSPSSGQPQPHAPQPAGAGAAPQPAQSGATR
jgi:hypothetical protein